MPAMVRAVDVGAFAAQVARNCLVADAHRWGYFSLCGLLLRLRDLYKREAGLEPWARVESAASWRTTWFRCRRCAGPWLLRKVLPEARTIWDAARAGQWDDAETLRCMAARRLELRLDSLFGLFDGDPPHAEAARRAEQFEKELTGSP